ncbi:recombinase family protein [Candidatus Woesearchaeota archaeon]|jgi:site-specific DNA recombinase|nr:recombinase family protein [Candidatus Woesearchaeota archaeon]MBT7238234.1 recombinase family protein [Candidatus Woesearchaeota archaeon]
MTEIKLKTAIYVRVSTEEQAKEGISISAQIDRCQNYCKARSWKVINVYTDAGYSAGSMKRPGVQQLFKDLNENKFENILVYKFDRFSRNVRDLITFLDQLNEKQVNFTSVTENIDTTTAMGEAFFQMIGVFAQLERGMVKERVKLAFDKKISDGESLSRAPLGYIYNNGKLAIDKLNSKKIKTIFEMRVAGIHYKIISEKLNIPISTLYTIIKNPTYAGKVKYNGEIYEGTHKPIIDLDLFNNLNPQQSIKSNTLIDWVS